MSYLVDTSWAVAYLRGNRSVVERFHSMRNEGLAVSIVTVAELYEGIFRSNNPTQNETEVRGFLDNVVVLVIDEQLCIRFGREMARLMNKGMVIGDIDLFIAVTALQYDLTLLTSDSDFERVAGLQVRYL